MSLVLEKGERYGSSDLGKGKTMVIDYSAPNVAKPFGIGHLRSTIIGQALYNLYNFLGWQTIGDNHLGDWGTQFGTLLYQITDKNLDPDTLDIEKLQELLAAGVDQAYRNPKIAVTTAVLQALLFARSRNAATKNTGVSSRVAEVPLNVPV